MTVDRSGRCAECGFDWDTEADAVVPDVAAIGRRFRQTVSRITGDHPADSRLLSVRPGQDVWSVVEYLAHMRDIVDFFDGRIERVLSKDRPSLPVTATFAELAEIRRYRDDDPAVILDVLNERAVEVAQRLSALDADQWRRVGIGSGGEERTVLLLARRLAHEACHHLADIEPG